MVKPVPECITTCLTPQASSAMSALSEAGQLQPPLRRAQGPDRVLGGPWDKL